MISFIGKALNIAAVVPTNIMIIAAGLMSIAILAPLAIIPPISANRPNKIPMITAISITSPLDVFENLFNYNVNFVFVADEMVKFFD
ncbi:hypothetical protein [Thermosyntropha sp.]|uniref:hypothetical protein n=1 Tax=Thermosyntropha sp. TaxID=2740820 RepID=UPI0025D2BEF7|nr:hypothetical protein [Thermosyntropha sp.]